MHILCYTLCGVVKMFKDVLRKLRVEKGLSQAELAEKLDCAPASIGSYEQGQRIPRNKMLYKIAKFFNVSVDYLFDFDNKHGENITLTKEEKRVILAYRENPALRYAVKKLLSVPDKYDS